MSDVIGLIIDVASLGVVNSFARSCRLHAQYVRDHADIIADALATPYDADPDDDSTWRLPNGLLHGWFTYFSEPKVEIEWVRGVARNWCYANNYATEYGCRGTPHKLYQSNEGRQYDHIAVGDRLTPDGGVMTINIMSGKVGTGALTNAARPKCAKHPLKGYHIDRVIVPCVINAWVDKILESVPTIKQTRLPIIYVDDNDTATDIIRMSGLLTPDSTD